MFEYKVLREVFGTKREEITGEKRNLHNAELHVLHSSPNTIRNINIETNEMDRTCSTQGAIHMCKHNFSGKT